MAYMNKTHLLLAKLTFAASPLLCMTVSAQDSGALQSARSPEPLDTVVVVGEAWKDRLQLDSENSTGSRLGLTLRETPAIVDVLSQEQMQALGAHSTLDALNRVPGVYSANVSTSPGQLTLRGFADGAVSLLYDGVRPAVPALFSRVQDSWMFDRIEVLKGPSSVLYGEGALAGTVNLVPKHAEFGSNRTSAQLGIGRFDSVRLAGDHNMSVTEHTSVRAVGSYSRSDGHVDDTASEFVAASLSTRWQAAEALTIDLAVDYSEDAYDTAYLGTPLVPREFASKPSSLVRSADGRVLDKAMRDVNFNVTDAILDSDTVWLRSRLEYRFAPRWTLSNTLHVYRSDRRFINAEFFGFNETTQLVDRSTGIVTHDFEYWTDRATLNGDFELGALRNRLAVGVEYAQVDFFTQRRFGSTTSVDPYHPDRGRFPEGDDAAIFPSRQDRDNTLETRAVYAENALNLTPRWLLVAGARYDEINIDRVATNLNTTATTPVAKAFHEVTWRAGMVYDVLPRTQVFAQYSTAAEFPASAFNLLPASVGFELTKGESVEVGIKSSLWHERVDLTFAAFRIEQDDIVTRDPADVTRSIQGGRRSSEGVELALAAAPLPRLRVYANLSLVNAEFEKLIEAGGADRRGNTPARVPEEGANLFAFYELAALPLTVGGGVHRSGRFFTDNANTIRVGAHTTLEASASWRVLSGEFTLRGRNLTDEFYADYSDMSPDQLAVAPPRSVELTYTTQF
jgi:iron complex outermembrane receptor protein